MHFIKVFIFGLCLFVSYENASQAIETLNQEVMSCCCVVEEHSDSCSECPEEVASNYCGCKDFSLNFIPPDLWVADHQPVHMESNSIFSSSFISWDNQPETPPPRQV